MIAYCVMKKVSEVVFRLRLIFTNEQHNNQRVHQNVLCMKLVEQNDTIMSMLSNENYNRDYNRY